MADFSTCPCLFRGLHRLAKRYILRRCSAQCTMYSLFRAHHDQSRRKMKNYVWSLSVRQGKTLAARNEITPGYLIWTATKYIWNQFVVKHTASHWRQRKQLSLLKGSKSDQQPSTEANKKECFALSLSLSLPLIATIRIDMHKHHIQINVSEIKDQWNIHRFIKNPTFHFKYF